MRTTKKQQQANQPELVSPLVTTPENIEQTVQLVGKYYFTVLGNCMEPRLRDGYKVSGELVEKERWPEITGPIAVSVGGKITIGRTMENDLKKTGTITLTPDNQSCISATFNEADLTAMWSIENIISGKVV